MSNQTTTQNAVFIPEIIANQSIGYLGALLNLGKTVTKDSELTSVSVGQTVSIPKRGAVTAQQKAQGSDATTAAPTATEVTVTIDQHWYVRIGEEDFTRAFQQGGSVLPGYAEDGLAVLAEKIESNLGANITSFPSFDIGGSAADDAVKAVAKARRLLVEAKAPQVLQWFGYASPSLVEKINIANAFIDPKLIPNNRALTEGTVGRVKGFDMFEGQLVPTEGSPSVYQNFFYTKRALVLATRGLALPGSGLGVESAYVPSDAGIGVRVMRFYDKDALATQIQMDVLFGSGIYDVRQGVVLQAQ